MNNPWIETARANARRIAAEKGRVTIDEVRAVCPPPEGTDPRIMGNILKIGFVCIGFEPSKRAECHGRTISIFKLDKAA